MLFFSKTFLFGAAVGAAAMYLLDPNNGEQRRREAEKAARELAERPEVRKATDQVKGQVKEATEQVKGQVTQATHEADDGGTADGSKTLDSQTLADKVRSEVLGREEFAGLVVNVEAHDGDVVLRGIVDDPSLRQRLVTAVDHVAGVESVESYLHATNEPAPNLS